MARWEQAKLYVSYGMERGGRGRGIVYQVLETKMDEGWWNIE